MVQSKKPCPKCGNNYFTLGEVYMAGSIFTKLFNIQNKKFSTFTCSKCKYTELYQIPAKNVLNVLDFFVG